MGMDMNYLFTMQCKRKKSYQNCGFRFNEDIELKTKRIIITLLNREDWKSENSH